MPNSTINVQYFVDLVVTKKKKKMHLPDRKVKSKNCEFYQRRLVHLPQYRTVRRWWINVSVLGWMYPAVLIKRESRLVISYWSFIVSITPVINDADDAKLTVPLWLVPAPGQT